MTNHMIETDADDLPDLISSDEEGEIPKPLSNAECAEAWTNKEEKFQQRQSHSVQVLAFGPLLFAINDFVPPKWIRFLKESQIILYNKRDTELSHFDWMEWMMLDAFESVLQSMSEILFDRDEMITLLDLIDECEQRCQEYLQLDMMMNLSKTCNLMCKILESFKQKEENEPPTENWEKTMRGMMLYVGKIYHTVVTAITRIGRDVLEDRKRNIRLKDRGRSMKSKDDGNTKYQYGHFKKAILLYTQAAQLDPFNHIFYGNRAQTYNRMGKYREALADSRRATVLKPDWPKGYYRYAQSYFNLNRLDRAININKKGLRLCMTVKNADDTNIKELRKQGKLFEHEKEKSKADSVLREIITQAKKSDKEKGFDDEEDGQTRTKSHEGKHHVVKISSSDIEKYRSVNSYGKEAGRHLSTSHGDKSVEVNAQVVGQRETTGEEEKVTTDTAVSTEIRPGGDVAEKISVSAPRINGSNTVKAPSESGARSEAVAEDSTQGIKLSKQEVFANLLATAEGCGEGEDLAAIETYQKALDLVAANDDEEWKPKDTEMVAIKYAFAHRAISTNNHKNISLGIDKLREILVSHPKVKFPLAHVEMARAYIANYRYRAAPHHLREALSNSTKTTAVYWPGTKKKIEANTHVAIGKLCKTLWLKCRYPPPPDAVCRLHSNEDDSRVDIYVNDPDYKGFVHIVCDDGCRMDFHLHCWKDFKESHGDVDKLADKEMLNRACPTPECLSVISRIVIHRHDHPDYEMALDKKPVTKTDAAKKPHIKMLPSSERTIRKRLERKELRRRRRQEVREENSNLLENVTALMDNDKMVKNQENRRDSLVDMVEAEPSDHMINPPDDACLSVLRRDLDDFKDYTQPSASSKRRKKRKTKHLLPVEVNFSDKKELQSAQDVEQDEESERSQGQACSQSSSVSVFAVPASIQSQVQRLEQQFVPMETKSTNAEITKSLFAFFEDLLQEGPLYLTDEKITSLYEDFPEEAKEAILKVGGLSKFLQQSLRFALVGEVICLLKDAVKAQDLYKLEKRKTHDGTCEHFSKNSKEDFATCGGQGYLGQGRGHKSLTPTSENSMSNTRVCSGHSGKMDSLDEFEIPSNIGRGEGNTVVHFMDTLDTFHDDLAIETIDTIETMEDVKEDDDFIWESGSSSDSLEDSLSADILEIRGNSSANTINAIPQILPSFSFKLENSFSQGSSRSDVSERSELSSESIARAFMSEYKNVDSIQSANDLITREYSQSPGEMEEVKGRKVSQSKDTGGSTSSDLESPRVDSHVGVQRPSSHSRSDSSGRNSGTNSLESRSGILSRGSPGQIQPLCQSNPNKAPPPFGAIGSHLSWQSAPVAKSSHISTPNSTPPNQSFASPFPIVVPGKLPTAFDPPMSWSDREVEESWDLGIPAVSNISRASVWSCDPDPKTSWPEIGQSHIHLSLSANDSIWAPSVETTTSQGSQGKKPVSAFHMESYMQKHYNTETELDLADKEKSVPSSVDAFIPGNIWSMDPDKGYEDALLPRKLEETPSTLPPKTSPQIDIRGSKLNAFCPEFRPKSTTPQKSVVASDDVSSSSSDPACFLGNTGASRSSSFVSEEDPGFVDVSEIQENEGSVAMSTGMGTESNVPGAVFANVAKEEATSLSDSIQLQSKETSLPETIRPQSKETSLFDAIQLQGKETSLSATTQLQSKETSLSDTTQLPSKETSLSDTTQLQSKETSLSDTTQLPSKETSLSDTTQLPSKETSLSEQKVSPQQQIEELKRRLRIATSYGQEMQTRWQTSERKLQVMTQDMSQRSQTLYDIEEKYAGLQEQCLASSEKLANLKEEHQLLQKQSEDRKEELSIMCQSLQEEQDSISKVMAERDEMLLKAEKYRQKGEEHAKAAELATQRAVAAEVEVLTVKWQFFDKLLDDTLRESTFHQKSILNYLHKMNVPSQNIPAPIQQTMRHYSGMIDKCKAHMHKMRETFEDQIDQVQSGRTHMKELSPISMPPPPPAPPVPPHLIQQVLMQNLRESTKGSIDSAPVSLPLANKAPVATPLANKAPVATPLANKAPVATPFSNKAPVATPLANKGPISVMPSLHDPVRESHSPHAQSLGQPRDQRPLPLPVGMRPLALKATGVSLTRPRVASPVSRPVTSSESSKKTSYERLLAKLQERLPNCSRAMFQSFLLQLRQSRNGSLSGMTFDNLLQQIVKLAEQKVAMATLTKPRQEPGSGRHGEDEEEEDPCVICHEGLSLIAVCALNCGHRFHDECIRKWLNEQRTCPTCRIHTLLPDEFPSL